LPAGLTLNSDGTITGTLSGAGANTTPEVIFTVTDTAPTPNLKGDVVIIFNIGS
jgi:hypothetical protein